MNINFELYRIFYTVAENKNITKASEELHITQPAISKSIKKLEEQLGGKLFTRTQKGVTLTKEGEEFYKYIKKALEFIHNAENKFTDLINLETGSITIGASTTITREYLIKYLEVFHKLYPNIKIEISTFLTADLIPLLRNGLVDIVFLNDHNINYGNDITITRCMEIKDCFVVNKEYEELSKETISLKDLVKYPLILQSPKSNTREFLNKIAKDNNIELKPNIELASYNLVIEFTKIGLGIGYATKNYITKELNNKELFEIKLKEHIPSRYIGYALSTNHEPNFSTKKLIEIITENK